MREQQRSAAMKLMVFALGLGVLLLALALLSPYSLGGFGARIFTTVSALSLYLLVFGPLVLGDDLTKLTAGRIVAGGMYGVGTAAYALLTVITIWWANFAIMPPLALLTVLQVAGLVGVLALVVVGDSTRSHINAVDVAQGAQFGSVEALRSVAAQLAAVGGELERVDDAQSAKLAKDIARIVDEIRYLSPVSSLESADLEQQIARNMRDLTAQLDNPSLDAQSLEQAQALANDTQRLIRRRKQFRS